MKKISPKRTPEDRWVLLYTLHEGGQFETLFFDKKKYALLKKNTYFDITLGDAICRIYPSYALLVEAKEGHDFVIRQHNGEMLATGQQLIFKRV
jgi:hypothetical protein